MAVSSSRRTVTAYYQLAKPGIVYGNLLSLVGGFLLAARGAVDWKLLVPAMAGTAAVIASGCVFNNYIDRGIDRRMKRTRSRALVRGEIPAAAALIYGTVLGLAGFAVLAAGTNRLTAVVGAIGFVFYVVVYSLAKRLTPAGTIIGSVSGSMPLVAGYTAVSGRLDGAVLLLFIIMTCWQMPHFYAIALYRLADYWAAGLPVLPSVRGSRRTIVSMLAYTAAFSLSVVLLTGFGYTGRLFACLMLVTGGRWLWIGLTGLAAADSAVWARRMFRYSLTVLLIFTVLLSADHFLP